jgi:hypothetical protein
VWDDITAAASAESALWAEALRPVAEQEREAVFSPLAPAEHALGLETIYEGYLVHFGRSRLFAPEDDDTALLLGDYLYAHGLVHIAESGDVKAVADLAALISHCSHLRADGLDGDGQAWVATSSSLGNGASLPADERAVAAAHAAHARFVG